MDSANSRQKWLEIFGRGTRSAVNTNRMMTVVIATALVTSTLLCITVILFELS